VPEENYWFRRHLVVYEWIARHVAGMRVIDMACGEGYGSNVLAGAAASVVGVDANPDAHEHARLRYRRANLRFERDLVESFAEEADAVVFLQTIEHLSDPDAALEHFRSLVESARRGGGRGRGTVFLSTPNVLTLDNEEAKIIVGQNVPFQSGYSTLGIALAAVINLLNVEMVVMGGGVVEAGDLILKPTIKETRRRAFPPSFNSCEIVIAKLGGTAGMIGAALMARDQVS
jgi:2-polyprenyl-3-methyl-5-hydroxy-6-metoxy-1,4-benzoquinol methylase